MKISTVRHGQTDWNAAHRLQGQIDIPLNEMGKAQAAKIAERFKDDPIDVIFTTPLSRALTTAQIINQHLNVPIIQLEGLKEMSFGELEGSAWEDIKDDLMKHRAGDLTLESVEIMRDFFERVHREMDHITGSDYKNILIVGHYGTIRSIVCYFKGLDYTHAEDFVVGNTAVHTFEKADDGFKMTLENDSSHLDEAMK